jgi:hypothetical protein
MQPHEVGWRNLDSLPFKDSAVVSENVDERLGDCRLQGVTPRLTEKGRSDHNLHDEECLLGTANG